MAVNIYNQDCMIAMASMKDKEYDLAIVDPQYNIGGDALHSGRALSGAGKLKDRVIHLGIASQFIQNI